MLRGRPRTLLSGPSEMMGLVRMPRTSGNCFCCAMISSELGSSIQAWATMALGMPWRSAIPASQRVSATCWLRSHSASICTVATTLCNAVSRRYSSGR